jgi:ribose transport system ATP-binding protein
VDLNVYPGEIRGLIGENGSGKSTLGAVFTGIYKNDSGSLRLRGSEFKPLRMNDALKKGVGMIVQENGTIPGISVAENIFLGETARFRQGVFINRRSLHAAARDAMATIGLDSYPVERSCSTLDMQERKLVEVAKVVYKKPDILVIDETTTALSQKGREIIYRVIKDWKAKNRAVLFISHDLDELIEHCDTLTVLRDGKLIRNLEHSEFSEDLIKKLMVGREMGGNYYRDDWENETSGEIVLSLKNGTKGRALRGVSLDLHKGEILGIGGLSECGMHTLGKCLFGFTKLESGEVTVTNSGLSRGKATGEKSAMKLGMGYVSKDRDVEALSLMTSIKENISIAGFEKIGRRGLISPLKEKKYVQDQINALSIKCSSMNQYAQYLSGGNKQKVVFGKWIGRGSDILILDCPTRGIDIGVKQYMYQLMYQMKREGKSIIMISEELTELIGMSDRLLIMKDGRIAGEFPRSVSLNEADIINYMI